MALMLIARYNYLFTRPRYLLITYLVRPSPPISRILCRTRLGSIFRGLLFSVIMLQVYISTGVWLVLLFVYYNNMQCGAVWQLVTIFVER